MSFRERAKELSKRLAATYSDISFPIVYRKLQAKSVSPTSGTITNNYSDVYGRAFQRELNIREYAVGAGVVERGDVLFNIAEDVVTPRSEEDEIYKSIYSLGTVSINTGATQVTGASVDWSVVEPGDYMRFGGQGTFHRIASVLNVNSQLALSEAYSQSTLTGATYRIYRPYQVVGWNRDDTLGYWEIQGRRI
jgi:hypothetical protein